MFFGRVRSITTMASSSGLIQHTKMHSLIWRPCLKPACKGRVVSQRCAAASQPEPTGEALNTSGSKTVPEHHTPIASFMIFGDGGGGGVVIVYLGIVGQVGYVLMVHFRHCCALYILQTLPINSRQVIQATKFNSSSSSSRSHNGSSPAECWSQRP